MLTAHQKTFVRFCFVGGINTLIDIAIFSLLFYVLSVPLLIANSLGFAAAVVNSYLLNKFWTYQDHTAHSGKKILGFVLIALVGLAISNTTVWLLAPLITALGAKIVACGLSVVWNYAMTRLVIFRAPVN